MVIAYDQIYNRAFCEDCTKKIDSGEIKPDDIEIEAVTLEEMKIRFAGESHYECSWCDKPIWTDNKQR
jgi:hypothetical protein